MSLHQALGPLMWARVTAAAGWAWPPPREPCRPPGAGVGGRFFSPTMPIRVTCTPGGGWQAALAQLSPES